MALRWPRRPMMRGSAKLALGLFLLAACAAPSGGSPSASPSSAAPTAEPTTANLQGDFDVGGRSMHIYCAGPVEPGQPTVVFESGLGGQSLEWNPVLHELNDQVRACVYDRAGTGRGRQSEPAAVGRTTSDQVADLHALLQAANVPPPYILVGFSLGGWNAMVYNDVYPAEVVGAVMVDVRSPAFSQRSLEVLPPADDAEPTPIKEMRFDLTTFETDPTLNDEGLILGESAAEAVATDGFGDKPLLVLAAADASANYVDLGPDLAGAIERIWWELQDELVARSSAGRLVKVDSPSHDVPYERPDAVADAIREVLGTE